MPMMVKLAVNTAYNPKDERDRALYKSVIEHERKRKAPLEVAAISAQESVFFSKGMYKIITPEPKMAEPRALEEMPSEELKTMMLSLGIKTEKQMRRADIINLIRRRLDEVEIVEDA